MIFFVAPPALVATRARPPTARRHPSHPVPRISRWRAAVAARAFLRHFTLKHLGSVVEGAVRARRSLERHELRLRPLFWEIRSSTATGHSPSGSVRAFPTARGATRHFIRVVRHPLLRGFHHLAVPSLLLVNRAGRGLALGDAAHQKVAARRRARPKPTALKRRRLGTAARSWFARALARDAGDVARADAPSARRQTAREATTTDMVSRRARRSGGARDARGEKTIRIGQRTLFQKK